MNAADVVPPCEQMTGSVSTWPLRPIPAAGLRPTELQWEVLSDEVVSMKKDHHINLKLHFEVGGLQGWTGEQSGEDHI